MTIAPTVLEHLTRHHVPFEVLIHPQTDCSTKTAAAAHIPGDRLAKGVVVEDEEGHYLMVVVPATHRVQLGYLHQVLHRRVGLATEAEVAALFADCERGAIPPLGAPYGMETWVDEGLAEQPDVYFECGDHEELIHVRHDAFLELLESAHRGRISRHV
jgi:Ala-tRNA(Pro) deacylase